MECFIPGEIFRKKSNTFRGITVFPLLPKRPKFSVPFVWITSARLHVERKRIIYRYFVMVQLNPVPVFGAKKNTRSTISRKFFTENSLQMLSSYNLSIDTNQPPLVVHGRGILQNAKRPPKAERI